MSNRSVESEYSLRKRQYSFANSKNGSIFSSSCAYASSMEARFLSISISAVGESCGIEMS